jgi:hypothetical protein
MYLDAVVVEVETFLLLFRLAMAILCLIELLSISNGYLFEKLKENWVFFQGATLFSMKFWI